MLVLLGGSALWLAGMLYSAVASCMFERNCGRHSRYIDSVAEMPPTQPQPPPLPPPPCRRIRTAPQLCQFLAAVIPQDPPAAPGTAAAAAAASALPASRLAAANNPLAAAAALAAAAEVAPVGARKRKLNSLLEEVSMDWCDGTIVA